MNIKDHCEQLRNKILQLEAEVRMVVGSEGSLGDVYDHAILALVHLENSRMRLGQLIQHHDGGVSVYDQNALPMPAGSETHPLDKTAEGAVAPPYTHPDAPQVSQAGPPVQPMPVPPSFQPPATVPAPMALPQVAATAHGMDAPTIPGQSSPAPAQVEYEPMSATDWANLEDMKSQPVTMNPHNDEEMANNEPAPPAPMHEEPKVDEPKPEEHSVAHSDEPLPAPHQEDKEGDVNP